MGQFFFQITQSPRNGSQNWLSCPTETARKWPVSSQLPKVNTMLKLPWPLLTVNLRILGLIGRGTTYFVQNKTTIVLRGDTQQTTSGLPCPTHVTHFWRQIRSLKAQNGSYFSLLQSDTVLGTINPFSLRFNVISSEKSCLISDPFF